MPAKSQAQQKLFQAAEHGADFPMAEKLRESMTHDQLREFAIGPMKDKPVHVAKPKRKNTLIHGSHPDVINQNVKTLKRGGYSHKQALHVALKHSRKGTGKAQPKEEGQKPLSFHEGGLHTSTGTKPGQKISASEHSKAASGKLGPLAEKQENFYRNVLK